MTRFKGMPLFGPDSSPLYTSTVLAAIGTFSLSLIFFVVVMVVKPAKKEHEFREVQIVFKQEPKDEYEDVAFTASFYDPAESELEDIISENQIPLESGLDVPFDESSSELVYREQSGMTGSVTVTDTDKADKSKPSYKRQSAPKVSEQHTSNNIDSARSENRYDARKSVDTYRQQASKKKVEDYDWDAMFADDSNAVETTETVGHKVKSSNKFSGSAGKASDNSQGYAYSQNVGQKKTTETRASSQTTDALTKIAKTEGNSKKGNNGDGEAKEQKKSGGPITTGGINIEIYGGGTRRLVKPSPSNLSIKLSAEAASLISGSSTPAVVVEFIVLETGNVGRVAITPSSVLPDDVQDEIIAQVKGWQFEQAANQSTGHFDYKIINK